MNKLHFEQGGARGLVALSICALLWSSGGVFFKIIDWNPVAIAGIRSLVGGVFILAVLRRPKFKWSPQQITGAISYSLSGILFIAANKLTTAANAILLQYTAPLYAAVFAWFFLHERVTVVDWATIVVALGGMVFFFLDRIGRKGMTGNLFAVTSGIFFAGAVVALRLQKDDSPFECLLLSHGITFVISIPFFWGSAPSLAGWAGLTFLGIFQIGIPSLLLAYGMKRVTALQAMLISMPQAIFNPIWVFLFLGETPTCRALVGGLIVLMAVTTRSVISLREVRTRRTAKPARTDHPLLGSHDQ